MGADYGLVMQPEFVNLSPRARNALRGDGINTLDQIKEMTEVIDVCRKALGESK